MKKLLFLLIFPFLFSCGGNKDAKSLQSEIDSLKTLSEKKDDLINDFAKSFNEVQINLDQIKEKEKIIKISTTDKNLNQDVKEKINQDILSIYQLLLNNKQALTKLQKKFKNANLKIEEYKKMIDRYLEEIESKTTEVNGLKEELAKLNIDIKTLNQQIANLNSNVDSLSKTNKSKDEVLEKQDEALNTGYYVVGTKKDLEAHQIITKTGGFIGIGKLIKLQENFNKGYFNKIDIRNTTNIRIKNKKASLITSHPSGSYYFSGDKTIDELVIKNNKEFWSVSKYLVVVIE